jgi:hypothetical protein
MTTPWQPTSQENLARRGRQLVLSLREATPAQVRLTWVFVEPRHWKWSGATDFRTAHGTEGATPAADQKMSGGVTPVSPRNSESGRGDWIRTSDPCAQEPRYALSCISPRRQRLQVVDPTSVLPSDNLRNLGVTLPGKTGGRLARSEGRPRTMRDHRRTGGKPLHSPPRRTNLRGSALVAYCRRRASALRIASSTASSSLPTSSARKRNTK